MFDKEDVRERLRKMPGGPTQPMTVHLRQEIDRLNLVIHLTATTLRNLRLAIAGMVLPQRFYRLTYLESVFWCSI
jgi:dynein heavy chain, axonemal